MVHTVGIVGINGNVGVPTVKHLVKAAEEGKIKLVVFHRVSSKIDHIKQSSNIEFRILNFDGPQEELENAVKGVEVFVSAVGFEGLPSEPKLVDALLKSPDLVTYVPPTYSTTWTEADYADEYLGPIMNFIHAGWDKAKALGLSTTPFYTGVFDNYWFEIGFVGAPIKENQVWVNEKQLKNRVPITSLEHLGESIAKVVTEYEPSSIKDKEFSVVTFWPSGQELVDLYSKINGKPAHVKDWTKADRDAKRADAANFGAAPAGYWDKWEDNDWQYESGGKTTLSDYSGPSLEEMARSFAQK